MPCLLLFGKAQLWAGASHYESGGQEEACNAVVIEEESGRQQ